MSPLARRSRVWPRPIPAVAPARSPGPGWVVAPPDFVGIGVQKAGTSWWYDLITEHPRVQARPGGGKELHFFQDHWHRPFDDGDRERYTRHFARPEGQLAGEWTPRYMLDPWVPPLLARAAPDAKLLVIVRDPVERFRSGVAHERRIGAPDHPIVATDAFHRGLYWRQISHVLQFFARSQLLVLQYERCVRDPQAELARTFAFLGLEPHAIESADRVVNRTPSGKPDPHEMVADAFVAAYEDDTRRLLAEFPDLDVSLWPELRDRLGR